MRNSCISYFQKLPPVNENILIPVANQTWLVEKSLPTIPLCGWEIIEISMRIVQFAMFDFRRVTPSHDLEKITQKERAVFSFMAPPENMLKLETWH